MKAGITLVLGLAMVIIMFACLIWGLGMMSDELREAAVVQGVEEKTNNFIEMYLVTIVGIIALLSGLSGFIWFFLFVNKDEEATYPTNDGFVSPFERDTGRRRL